VTVAALTVGFVADLGQAGSAALLELGGASLGSSALLLIAGILRLLGLAGAFVVDLLAVVVVAFHVVTPVGGAIEIAVQTVPAWAKARYNNLETDVQRRRNINLSDRRDPVKTRLLNRRSVAAAGVFSAASRQ
jgi:hypothetical protein